MLVSGAVVNATRADKKARVATQLVVGFNTDLGRLLPELGAAVAAVPGVMADPAPVATFNRFAPNGFELEVGMWIAEPDKGRLDVLSEANMRIWRHLQSNEVTFPAAATEVK
jgi:small-conductance mechanosensitive channel